MKILLMIQNLNPSRQSSLDQIQNIQLSTLKLPVLTAWIGVKED